MNPALIRAGCDIVNIARFQKILMRTPAMRKRLFLPREEKDASFERLAGIFAAKEAVIKALGLKAGDWKKIEITKKTNGRPEVKLPEFNGKILSRDISISHDGEYAMAVTTFLLTHDFN